MGWLTSPTSEARHRSSSNRPHPICQKDLVTHSARRSHPLFLILFILLSCIPHITSAAASPPKCLSSLPPHRFDTRPPRPSTTLTYCKEYSSSTCCNATHTQSITRQLYPYYSTTLSERDDGYGVNEQCRQLISSLHCSPCHPQVGTGQLAGVCPESCDALYTACAPSLFEHVNGILQPCTPSTLVCSELSSFVSNGADLCRHLGFTMGASSPVPSLPSLSIKASSSAVSSSDLHSAFTSLVSAASRSIDQPTCFHASSSPYATLGPSSKRTTTTKPSTAASTAATASSTIDTLMSAFSSLPDLASAVSALVASLPTSVVQWRKQMRRLMRSHASSGVSIAVLAVVVVIVLLWPRIRSWLNRQRWKARLSADGLRRQRVARLGNNNNTNR